MTTITIEVPRRGDVNNIAIAVRQLKGVAKITVQPQEPFERIPGLAYTQEERLAAIRRAEEDYAAGRFYSAEEVRAMFPRP